MDELRERVGNPLPIRFRNPDSPPSPDPSSNSSSSSESDEDDRESDENEDEPEGAVADDMANYDNEQLIRDLFGMVIKKGIFFFEIKYEISQLI